MVREIVTLCVGQCGIQLGRAIWEQYCVEHQIAINPLQKEHEYEESVKHEIQDSFLTHFGKLSDEQYAERNSHWNCILTFGYITNIEKMTFLEIPNSIRHLISIYGNKGLNFGDSIYFARNLMIDLDKNLIDDMKCKYSYDSIFNPKNYFICGQEDAANNFARGHYTVGKEVMDEINDSIRKSVECCENHQGFIMSHGVGGGTGSGLGALILERIGVDYRKKIKMNLSVYSSPNHSNCVVEPYNALLSTHWLLDHCQVSVILDNEAIYELCQRKLKINIPSYHNMNRLISKVVSSMTAPIRFGVDSDDNLHEFQRRLVPLPRQHFLISSMDPIVTNTNFQMIKIDEQSLTERTFESNNFLVKIPYFDPEQDSYTTIQLNYRGNIKPKMANAAVIRTKLSTLRYYDGNHKMGGWWMSRGPTGPYPRIFDKAPPVLNDDYMSYSPKHVTMIANNVAIGRVFAEKINRKYDAMYSQRAFVHWYTGEGMEEGEFAEARENLGFLEKDYLDEYDSPIDYSSSQ